MGEVDLLGIGAWSDRFADWSGLLAGLQTGTWQTAAALQPERIAPRERRRAPKPVKMAIEVMSQACEMASLQPDTVATVFSSAMGDMQITDYMCSTLAKTPEAISPTRFHNSVHNAPTGYWSIATRAHGPANAVSAYLYTAPVAFMEAAIQVVEENIPVLLVTQEGAAPPALLDTCPTGSDFAAALLLAPSGYRDARVASIRFTVDRGVVDWPEFPSGLKETYSGHLGARLLPLLAAIADPQDAQGSVRVSFPLSKHSNLALTLNHAGADD